MTGDFAERCSRAVIDRIVDARAELFRASEVPWVGPAAEAYGAALRRDLAALVRLRAAADEAHGAVARHRRAVDAARAGALP